MTTNKVQILSSKFYGEFSRYKITEMKNRFGSVEWFVEDAECIDKRTKLPKVIRQTATREDAVAGLL